MNTPTAQQPDTGTAPRRGRTPALGESEARLAALAAATRLYYARGIQSVGMDALAAESGIGLKRLYQLFPSKDAIVEQVLDGLHASWDRDIAAAVDAVDEPRDQLLAIYDYLDAWFAKDNFRGCAFINSFGELGASSPAVAVSVREHKHGFQEFVADIAERAGAPRALGRQLAILAEGAQTTAAIAGEGSAAKLARDAAEVLITAALGPADRP